MGRLGCLTLYASVILLIASCSAWQTYSAPFDCIDDEGHGPDPGTECDNAIAHAREYRGEQTRDAFIVIVLIGAMTAGVWGIARFAMDRIEKGPPDRSDGPR